MELDLLSADAVQVLTAPFHRTWVDEYGVALDALKLERERDPGGFLAYEPSTIAKMLRDRVVRGVRRHPEVVGSLGLGTFTQLINGPTGCVAARFKELNEELNPYVHRSERQDGLDTHRFDPDDLAQLSFDGMRASTPTLITVGYRRGFDVLEITRILVVFHYRHKPHWYFDLGTGTVEVPQSLPGLGQPPKSTIAVPGFKKAKKSGTE
jgi:hypothetical protein